MHKAPRRLLYILCVLQGEVTSSTSNLYTGGHYGAIHCRTLKHLPIYQLKGDEINEFRRN